MKYKAEKHYFEKNIHAYKRYNELLKESNLWQGMGQYWLAHQCDILATYLLNGDTTNIDKIVKTEGNFWKTKKFM